MLQIVVFILVFGGALIAAFRQFAKIRRNILLGKAEPLEGPVSERWKIMFLIAFGQKKMFKNWIPAIFHFFIYAAFLLTQIELIEIVIDGITGHHRIFAPALGGFYTFLISFIELMSVLAFIATFVFLARRNLLKVPRFQMNEMNGWPKLDGNLILYGEILLLVGIFSMNTADLALQNLPSSHYHTTGNFLISSQLAPNLFGLSEGALIAMERFGWWLHLLVVLAFLNYLPISKHLHILLAFPNTFYARLSPRGAMDNMPEIMNEVKSMMGLAEEVADSGDELPEFGANDIFGLSRINLMNAYSCTECGRCTAVCPANITGKQLSPRKIMMDVRDRAEAVGQQMNQKGYDLSKPYNDGKSLFDYISREEIHACTTCNACVEACPVMINPLDIILKLRRYEILSLSEGPSDWLPMFNSIENSGSAWSIPDARDQWAN